MKDKIIPAALLFLAIGFIAYILWGGESPTGIEKEIMDLGRAPWGVGK